MFYSNEYRHLFSLIDDNPQVFPSDIWNVLNDLQLPQSIVPIKYLTRKSNTAIERPNILKLLFELGKGNLSVGRIFEGHVNALFLLEQFGTERQKEAYFTDAAEGKIFGVWNTERASDGLKLHTTDNGLFCEGAKIFCSGALKIHRPIVTAHTTEGLQMIILELDNTNQLREDWSLWNPIGMLSSVSCRLDFTGLTASRKQLLGEVNTYYQEPHFSFGAVRFSAVQLGGAQRIFEEMLVHLQKMKRTNDTYQKMRLGKAAILMESAELWMDKASKLMHNKLDNYTPEMKIHFANMMRTATSDICNEMIALAETAVGIQSTMQSHPIERPIRDLRVYLKQAGPDAALDNIGKYVATTKSKLCQTLKG
ncbi:MAG: acyl-CoA dehydrogenase family protein [Aquaticitalea sp.]